MPNHNFLTNINEPFSGFKSQKNKNCGSYRCAKDLCNNSTIIEKYENGGFNCDPEPETQDMKSRCASIRQASRRAASPCPGFSQAFKTELQSYQKNNKNRTIKKRT